MRVACVMVPFFPLAARLRGEPSAAGAPLAVLDGPKNLPRVVALSEAARNAGLGVGLTLPQARALLPALDARPRDAEAERSAREALREAADEFSPAVEDAAPGLVYLDWDGVGDELRRARELALRAARAGLPSAKVGVAGSRAAARLAARVADGSPVVVPPGGDARFLAPQPVARLRPSEELSHSLSRWGVGTLGQLASLPEGALAERLGREGVELRRLARGLDDRPLVPTPAPGETREGVSLDWAIGDLETLLVAAEGPLARLAARLASRAQAARALSVDLALDPSGRDSRRLELAAPSSDPETWLGLLRLELAARPPAAGVCGLSAAAESESPRQVQLTLFGPAAQSPDALASLLTRLSALLGPGRLGSPRPAHGHRPERFSLVPYDPPPPPETRPGVEAMPGRPACALRALRPWVELEADADPAPPHRPRALRGAGISGRVRVASGPWRLDEGWWTDDSSARDSWDVELSDGAVYRVFRDLKTGKWFADGLYD